jgi:phosphomethylpyrimidine synthase
MKISQEVRDYAKGLQPIDITVSDNSSVGMQQKAAEFRARGSELYHPAKEDL